MYPEEDNPMNFLQQQFENQRIKAVAQANEWLELFDALDKEQLKALESLLYTIANADKSAALVANWYSGYGKAKLQSRFDVAPFALADDDDFDKLLEGDNDSQ